MTTLSLRERRYQQALKDRARLERQRDEMLDKLTRVTGNLKTVRRSIERYERTPASPPIPAPAIVEPPVQPVAGAVAAASGSFDDLEAPAFLRR
jgi:hypothetical protein